MPEPTPTGPYPFPFASIVLELPRSGIRPPPCFERVPSLFWPLPLFFVKQMKDKTGMGSNFIDYTKLGFANQAALDKAHKSVDLKYLSQIKRTSTRLL